MNNEGTWRYTFLTTLYSLMAIFIIAQLVRIQTNPEQVAHFLEQSKIFDGDWRPVKPARGLLYDRWGKLLAGNTTVYEVGVELAQVRNPHSIALTLNVILGLDYAEVLEAVSQEVSPKAVYVVLADYVSQEKISLLEKYRTELENTTSNKRGEEPPSLRGLVYVPHLQRSYPEKQLASNVLGFVNREGLGYYGIEAKFDDLIAGNVQDMWIPRDPNLVNEMPDITSGASIVLTIDRAIQAEIEAILDQAVEFNGAQSGTILVADPQSGEILAMATTPRLDLNEYWRYGEVFKDSTPFNRAVSQAYEPGSVYKVLTMAAALDSGAVTPDTEFIDVGVIEVGGIYIYNWNSAAWGPQDMQGCLQHSLNVCLAWVATQLGTKDFYDYMRAFGIGHLTGVDLAGEVTGRLKTPGDTDWYEADLGTNSFGQGVAVTPLQMVMAVSAIANEGKLVAPRIVRSIIDKGNQFDTEKRLIGIPIKPETARTLSEMLARSLEEEASDALVEGYRLAGKTGTAEIPTPYGYSLSATNASFVGWGPLDDPRFLVYVWLEKPTSSPWGSVVAAPVFHDIVERLVVLMDIPPDNVRREILASH
ncbi:MAG: penicillin-binding protein 2 [Anaerolineales bacterium]|nr:MAG: penicillin-binding protein 2 [Anaerolineales bacterium]